MPITLSKIAADTASVAFSVGGDMVNIVYFPSKVTGKLTSYLDQGAEEMSKALATIISSWDIYEDNEMTTLLPIDADHLDSLGIGLEIKIAQAIIRDIRPEQKAT